MVGLNTSVPAGQNLYAPAYAPAPAAAAWTVDLGPAVALSSETWTPSQAVAPAQNPKDQLKTIRVEIKDLLAQINQAAAATTATINVAGPVSQTSVLGDLQRVLDGLKHYLDGWFAPAPAPTPAPTKPPKPAKGATEFNISSFNVLGSSHTKAGGEKPQMASGVARIHGVVQLLEAHHVDVVGFQEMQDDQLKEFLKLAGDKYAVYSGAIGKKKDTDNTIAWRKDQWDLVKPGTISVPYFDGHERKMPVVRLRNKQTGQEAYFINVHNPADTRKHHNQQRYRDEAARREIALVNKLMKETGLPVFITGDMNERENYYKKMSQGAPMQAANAGPKGPRQIGIDWIFGSKDVKFSHYVKDRGALVQKTTDHPMVVSKARIDGR